VSAAKPPTGQQQPEGFLSVGNTSSYLDLHDRYYSLLMELVPIADRAPWRSKEDTCRALETLVDRALQPECGRDTQPEPVDTDKGMER
jgi:hypothetical protein